MKTSKNFKRQLQKPILAVALFMLGFCLIQEISTVQAQQNLQINLKVQSTDSLEQKEFFAPFEQITLIANLTDKNVPQTNNRVTFLIEGPLNATSQTTQVRVVDTDSNGIAKLSFRLPMQQNNSQITGTWRVSASAATMTQKAASNTTFLVKWGIEISGSQFTEPTESQSGNVTVQLSIKNFDSHSKNLNVTGTIRDANNIIITEFKIENYLVANNSTEVIRKEINIPAGTSSGQATAEFNVYSGSYGGINTQVAETKFASFEITTNQIIHQERTDIGILNASVNPNSTSIGAIVEITATLINNGTQTETFLVKANSENGQIANQTVTLAASEQKEVTFEWDTSSINEGSYLITILIDKLQGETNIADNKKNAGTVILSYPEAFPQATSLFILVLVFSGIFTATMLLFFTRRNRENLKAPSAPLI
jgi:hypothetical protein